MPEAANALTLVRFRDKLISQGSENRPLFCNRAGGSFVACVALGGSFGVVFSALAPPARAQLRLHTLRGVDPELGAGRGGASREVTPKFLPRATQDAKFPPSGAGCGLRREGESFARCESDTTRAFEAAAGMLPSAPQTLPGAPPRRPPRDVHVCFS